MRKNKDCVFYSTRFSTFYKLLILSFSAILCVACSVCPHPISTTQRYARVRHDLKKMFGNQEPVNQPITIYEAMARALKYNLDVRLKMMEMALSHSDLMVTSYKMLPDLVASAGYLTRSNDRITSSGLESEDRTRRVLDLQFSWNLLDFGVSYLSAKQKADMYLVALERRNKVIQNIVRDVRYAFWRALSAQRLLAKLRPAMKEVQTAMSKSRLIEDAKIKGSTEALDYQRALWDTMREIAQLERDLIKSRAELAALINLRPGTHFTLAEPSDYLPPLPDNVHLDPIALEEKALLYRPELREEDYRSRISLTEINKARLGIIPNLSLEAGGHYDTNSFLLNNSWLSAGAHLVWNLINFIHTPLAIHKAKFAKKVVDARRLALAMTVLTEVDVAYLHYLQTREELKINKKIKSIDRRIYDRTGKQVAASTGDRLKLIRSKLALILSTLRYDMTYAAWQNAAGELLVSVGYNPLDHISTVNQPVHRLAQEIKQAFDAVKVRTLDI